MAATKHKTRAFYLLFIFYKTDARAPCDLSAILLSSVSCTQAVMRRFGVGGVFVVTGRSHKKYYTKQVKTKRNAQTEVGITSNSSNQHNGSRNILATPDFFCRTRRTYTCTYICRNYAVSWKYIPGRKCF